MKILTVTIDADLDALAAICERAISAAIAKALRQIGRPTPPTAASEDGLLLCACGSTFKPRIGNSGQPADKCGPCAQRAGGKLRGQARRAEAEAARVAAGRPPLPKAGRPAPRPPLPPGMLDIPALVERWGVTEESVRGRLRVAEAIVTKVPNPRPKGPRETLAITEAEADRVVSFLAQRRREKAVEAGKASGKARAAKPRTDQTPPPPATEGTPRTSKAEAKPDTKHAKEPAPAPAPVPPAAGHRGDAPARRPGPAMVPAEPVTPAGDCGLPDGPSMTRDEIEALGYEPLFISRMVRSEHLVLDHRCPTCGDPSGNCNCSSGQCVARFTRESVRSLLRSYRPRRGRARAGGAA